MTFYKNSNVKFFNLLLFLLFLSGVTYPVIDNLSKIEQAELASNDEGIPSPPPSLILLVAYYYTLKIYFKHEGSY